MTDDLEESGAQTFLTTTHGEFILLDGNRTDYDVAEGRLTPRASRSGRAVDALQP